jgi:riboflavin transporter FmnP
MQTQETQIELIQRRPILSARQIAVAVIFGAIAAAFEILQITIPGYLPGVNFNFGGIWLMLATMIGGPIAGAVVTLVDSITGQVGILGWPGYMIHVLILAAFYPRVYRIQGTFRRLGAFLLLTAVALFFQYWWWIGLYSFVLKIIPFWTQLSVQALAYWGFLAIYFVVPAILLWRVPKYVAPQWRWPWEREKEQEVVEE